MSTLGIVLFCSGCLIGPGALIAESLTDGDDLWDALLIAGALLMFVGLFLMVI